MKVILTVFCCLITFTFTACSPSNTPVPSQISSVSPTENFEMPSPYPSINPPQRNPAINNVIPFRLDKPVREGAQEITGSGPPGVPVMILDVTFMGNILGETTIDDDGTFIVTIPSLEKNHRIGLTIGYLDGTEWSPEDFYAPEFNGDEPLQVPMVDFFFDTTMVVSN